MGDPGFFDNPLNPYVELPEVPKSKKKIYLGIGIGIGILIIILVVVHYSDDPDPSEIERDRTECPRMNNQCTPQMKKTCYPCEPIPELAGDPSSPQAHPNPQCGVNRMTGVLGTCKPAIQWESSDIKRWNRCSPPPDDNITTHKNECFNCSAAHHDDFLDIDENTIDTTVSKLFDDDHHTNFFCESSCGLNNDFVNPDNFEIDTSGSSPSDVEKDPTLKVNPFYGFPKKYNEYTLQNFPHSSESSPPYLDLESIEGPYQFISNVKDDLENISNNFVPARNKDIHNDNVYWFNDPSSGEEFSYMYNKESPDSDKVISTQMCSMSGNTLILEQGVGSFVDDSCNRFDNSFFPQDGYLIPNSIIGNTDSIVDQNFDPSKGLSSISYRNDAYEVGPSPTNPILEKDDHISVNVVEPGYYYTYFESIKNDAFDFECRNKQLKPVNEELFREIDSNRYYKLGELKNDDIQINDDLYINLHIDNDKPDPSSENPHILEFNSIGLDITDNHDLSDIISEDKKRIKPIYVIEPNAFGNVDSYICNDPKILVWKNQKCSLPQEQRDPDFNINDCKPTATDQGVILPFECTDQCLYDPSNIGHGYRFRPGVTEENFRSYLSDHPESFRNDYEGVTGTVETNLQQFFMCSSPYSLDGSMGEDGITASCVDNYIQLNGCEIKSCDQVYGARGDRNTLLLGVRPITESDLPKGGCTPDENGQISCENPDDCIIEPDTVNCSDIIRNTIMHGNTVTSSDLDVLIGQDGQNNGLFKINESASITVDNENQQNTVIDTCLSINDQITIGKIDNLCKNDNYKISATSSPDIPAVFLSNISGGSTEIYQQFNSYIRKGVKDLTDYCVIKTCSDYIPNCSLPDLKFNEQWIGEEINQNCNPSSDITYNYKNDFDTVSDDIFETTNTQFNGININTLNEYISDPANFPILDNCPNAKVEIIQPMSGSTEGEYYISGCSNECLITEESFSELNPHSKKIIRRTLGNMNSMDYRNQQVDLNCGFSIQSAAPDNSDYNNPDGYHTFDNPNFDLTMFEQYDRGYINNNDYQNDLLNITCENGIIKFRGCNHVIEQYNDSSSNQYFSGKLYDYSGIYSNLFPQEVSEEAKIDGSNYNNWASCINFIPEINLDFLENKDLQNLNDIQSTADESSVISYPYKISPTYTSHSNNEYPLIGALCTNENNSIFSFGDYNKDDDGNITISNKICKDGYVPYGKLFDGPNYMLHYQLSSCDGLDDNDCNYRIDCKYSDGQCTSIDNSGCVNITTQGLNIPGSVEGNTYITKIDSGSLYVEHDRCLEGDNNISVDNIDKLENMTVPSGSDQYPNIYKDNKITSLMHCNHNDIVKNTDRLNGVIDVHGNPNLDKLTYEGGKISGNEYEKGDLRFRLNFNDHERLIKDGLDFDKTINEDQYESICPFGTILQLNEPEDAEIGPNTDFQSGNKNNYHYSCVSCPQLDPYSHEDITTVCGFNSSDIESNDINLYQMLTAVKSSKDSPEYQLLQSNYRLIPDDEGNICNDGYYYKYTLDDENQYDIGGSCQPKKCNVTGDRNGEYQYKAGSNGMNVNMDKWWAKDRIKGLTGIVSSSPNLTEDGSVLGINNGNTDFPPSWMYGGEDILTIYPEYNRIKNNDEINDYLIEGFENVGYNIDSYFSSSGNLKYCSGNPDALRDTCMAETDETDGIDSNIFKRNNSGIDSTIIYNASSIDDKTYTIVDPCIDHIDPTSYYPDEESCLNENVDKVYDISRDIHGGGVEQQIIGSNAWIPFDNDYSAIGNINRTMNENSIFSNLYDRTDYVGINPNEEELTEEIRGVCVRNKKLLYQDFFTFLREKAGIYPNMNLNDKINNLNPDTTGDTFPLLPKKTQEFFKTYSLGNKYYELNSLHWGPSNITISVPGVSSHDNINPLDSSVKSVFMQRVTSRYLNQLNNSIFNNNNSVGIMKEYFSRNNPIPDTNDTPPLDIDRYNQHIRMIWIHSFIKEFEKFYTQVIYIQEKLFSAETVEVDSGNIDLFIYPHTPGDPSPEHPLYMDCDTSNEGCTKLKSGDSAFSHDDIVKKTQDQKDSLINVAKGFEYWKRRGEFLGYSDSRDYNGHTDFAEMPHVNLSIDNNQFQHVTTETTNSQICESDDVCVSIAGNFDDSNASNASNWLENIDSCGWTMEITSSDNDKLNEHKNRYARQCNRLKWNMRDAFNGRDNNPNDNIYPDELLQTTQGDPYSNYNNASTLPKDPNEFIEHEFSKKEVPPNFYKTDDDSNIINTYLPPVDNYNYCISQWDNINNILTCNYLPIASPDPENSIWPDNYIQNIKQSFMGFLKKGDEGDLSLDNDLSHEELKPFFNADFSNSVQKRTISDQFVSKYQPLPQQGALLPFNNTTRYGLTATFEGGELKTVVQYGIDGMGQTLLPFEVGKDTDINDTLDNFNDYKDLNFSENQNKSWKIPCENLNQTYYLSARQHPTDYTAETDPKGIIAMRFVDNPADRTDETCIMNQKVNWCHAYPTRDKTAHTGDNYNIHMDETIGITNEEEGTQIIVPKSDIQNSADNTFYILNQTNQFASSGSIYYIDNTNNRVYLKDSTQSQGNVKTESINGNCKRDLCRGNQAFWGTDDGLDFGDRCINKFRRNTLCQKSIQCSNPRSDSNNKCIHGKPVFCPKTVEAYGTEGNFHRCDSDMVGWWSTGGRQITYKHDIRNAWGGTDNTSKAGICSYYDNDDWNGEMRAQAEIWASSNGDSLWPLLYLDTQDTDPTNWDFQVEDYNGKHFANGIRDWLNNSGNYDKGSYIENPTNLSSTYYFIPSKSTMTVL